MLKRAAVFVALALFIIMASLTDAHAEVRGPKIYGLQIGMPWEEAVQAQKAFAEKRGMENTGMVIALTKGGNTKASYLKEITFFPKAFGIDGIMTREMFEKICDNYGIPFNKMEPGKTPGGLRYTNSREGYIIGYTKDMIDIWEITRTSDMIME